MPHLRVLMKSSLLQLRFKKAERFILRHFIFFLQILITKYGEVGESEYLDPVGGQIVKFDHVRNQVIDVRPITNELDPDYEPFRLEMESQAMGYAKEYFPLGAATVYSSRNDNSIIICISSFKFNPDNCWNGRWRSIWYVQLGSDCLTLYGSIQINVHYFEDGNVQFNNDTQKTLQVPFGAV